MQIIQSYYVGPSQQTKKKDANWKQSVSEAMLEARRIFYQIGSTIDWRPRT